MPQRCLRHWVGSRYWETENAARRASLGVVP